jgi:glycerol kinase
MPGELSPVVIAIDQGTSSTKAVAVDENGTIVAKIAIPLNQNHPEPGWVEQDADEIADSVVSALRELGRGFPGRVAGVGISSQRESAVIWDRASGTALGPVLGWQDRRTTDEARRLTEAGSGDYVRASSGLPIDPMFSALKLAALLDAVDPDRTRSSRGEIVAGTVDSWLLARLTGEIRIETGNASRTQLLSLEAVDWDPELLELFRVPAEALPPVFASSAPSGAIVDISELTGVRVHAVLGDSHSALYAHGVREPGTLKVTYGTGSSIMGLVNAEQAQAAVDGVVKTIAWQDEEVRYAFEGNILSTGATLVWLAAILAVTPAQLAELAQRSKSSGGVNLVPAFSGLGAPWWDAQATAILDGFTLGSTRSELAAAAFESIAFQVEDVLAAADSSALSPVASVLTDGGPTSNDWLMQLQADLSQRTIERADVAEASALGVAHLAGVGSGVWSADAVLRLPRARTRFEPRLDPGIAADRRTRWLGAVTRSRSASNRLVP